MPVDIAIPGIGREVVIAFLAQGHNLTAAFIAGAMLIAPIAEYGGLITKQPKYDRLAKNLAKFLILLFAAGSAVAITFVLALITLYPVFWSYLQNIMFWPLLGEAFMFVAEIIVLYAWYATWDRMAYRKSLHVILGLMAATLVIFQFTLINVIGSYMLTPSEAPATDLASAYLNPTFLPLNMHRFVGNLSYAGFLIVGWAAFRYLRVTNEDDREYYDWMGHWGLIWGFGFMLLQPIIGYGYMKAIREHSPAVFDYIMLGDKAWLFELLTIELGIMGVASVAYFVHKLRFAVRPMPTLRNMTLGALGFMGLFSLLNVIPADADLVPQIGLTFAGGEETKIPLGSMYPWKYIGLIGLMFVGLFAVALYLKAAASGFHWGRASRWSQYALIVTAITVILTMLTMGYTRETSRRGQEPGFLINGCVTLEEEIVAEGCPGAAGGGPGGG